MKRTIIATLAVALTIAIMAIGVVAQVRANTQKTNGTYVVNGTYIILLKEDGTPFTVNGHVVKIKIINGTSGSASAASKTEPDITVVNIPISGSLPPQTYDIYGPFTSALQIDVSVTWTPASQILGNRYS